MQVEKSAISRNRFADKSSKTARRDFMGEFALGVKKANGALYMPSRASAPCVPSSYHYRQRRWNTNPAFGLVSRRVKWGDRIASNGVEYLPVLKTWTVRAEGIPRGQIVARSRYRNCQLPVTCNFCLPRSLRYRINQLSGFSRQRAFHLFPIARRCMAVAAELISCTFATSWANKWRHCCRRESDTCDSIVALDTYSFCPEVSFHYFYSLYDNTHI